MPATDPQAQRVRSASIELDKGVPFTQGAKHGLYAALGTSVIGVENSVILGRELSERPGTSEECYSAAILAACRWRRSRAA